METIFMNSKNGKTSDPHRMWLYLTKVKKKVRNMLLYQILACTIHKKT